MTTHSEQRGRARGGRALGYRMRALAMLCLLVPALASAKTKHVTIRAVAVPNGHPTIGKATRRLMHEYQVLAELNVAVPFTPAMSVSAVERVHRSGSTRGYEVVLKQDKTGVTARVPLDATGKIRVPLYGPRGVYRQTSFGFSDFALNRGDDYYFDRLAKLTPAQREWARLP